MRLETLADDFETVPPLDQAVEPCAALAVRVADEAELYVAAGQDQAPSRH